MAYLFTEILMISWHSDIEEALWKKPGQKIKDSEGVYDIN